MPLIEEGIYVPTNPEFIDLSTSLDCVCETQSDCTLTIDGIQVTTPLSPTTQGSIYNPQGAGNVYGQSGFGYQINYFPDPSSASSITIYDGIAPDDPAQEYIACVPNTLGYHRLSIPWSLKFRSMPPNGNDPNLHVTQLLEVNEDSQYYFQMDFTIHLNYCGDYSLDIPYRIQILMEFPDPLAPSTDRIPVIVKSTHLIYDGSSYVTALNSQFTSP